MRYIITILFVFSGILFFVLIFFLFLYFENFFEIEIKLRKLFAFIILSIFMCFSWKFCYVFFSFFFWDYSDIKF